MDRLLLIGGLALVLLGPGTGFALATVGHSYGLAAPPSTPTVTAPGYEDYAGCGEPENYCALGPYSSGGVTSGAVTWVQPLGVLFVTFATDVGYALGDVGSGRLVVLDTAPYHLIASVGLPCTPRGAYYPGEGVFAFTECAGSHNDSIVVFNVSSAAVAATIPVPENGSSFFGMALDSAHSILYCIGVNSTLTEVNVASDEYVTTIQPATNPPGSSPFYPWGNLLWMDVARGHLFFPSPGAPDLVEFDAGTGNVLATTPMPGSVDGISGDVPDNRLYVSFQPTTIAASSFGTEVLNLTSLAPLEQLNVSADAPIGFDRAQHEAYLSYNGGITVIDLGSGRTISDSIDIRGNTPVTYDLTQEQFVGLYAQDVTDLIVVNVTHSSTSVTPFVDVPVVGGSLPVVVAVSGLLLGGILLGAAAARSADRRWLGADQVK
ncbi:MAG: hypothetical protein L3K08_09215 [Thermoplasmata archaeon]|nr:hypothetical protein [Thermoplasmata archaeon]